MTIVYVLRETKSIVCSNYKRIFIDYIYKWGEILNTMTKELGQRIRAERTAKKMTQEELAERAGLHPTYIGQVERGEKSLTVASLEKIVEGLEISFSDLFENIQPSTKPAGYAMQCYNKISAYSKETQKQFYELICAAEKLMK